MNEPQTIFEDDFILLINKPSGIVVNRAKSVKGKTIQDWVASKTTKNLNKPNFISNFNRVSESNLSETDWDQINKIAFWQRNGIVHRLDKETSGIMIIAKTENCFVELLRQFRQREVQKTYLALVHGKIDSPSGQIKEPVGRLPWNRKRFGVLAGGRHATTKYQTLKTYFLKNKDQKKIFFTSLKLTPQTGRTHQIRIHLKHIGHPVVSDEFYAGRKTSRQDRTWCPRLFLHAHTLEFIHPQTKKRTKFIANLPLDLMTALETCSIHEK